MKISDEMILLLGYLATPSGSGASSVFAGWRNGVMIVMEESVSRSLLQQYLGGYVTMAANGGVVSSIAGAGSTGSAGGGAGARAGGGGGGAGSGGGGGGSWGGGGAARSRPVRIGGSGGQGLGTCNYGDLIDTLFTDVEGVA
jgi:hypothetical protein